MSPCSFFFHPSSPKNRHGKKQNKLFYLGPLKIYISCNDIVRFSGGHTVIASTFGWSYHQWRQWRRWYPLSYCVKGGGLLYTFINSSLVQSGEAVIRWVRWKYFQTSSQRKFLELPYVLVMTFFGILFQFNPSFQSNHLELEVVKVSHASMMFILVFR